MAVAPSPSASTPSARRLAGVRVLVVDDDRDGLELVASTLALAGADVLTATRAEDALALVRERPHVIVSDLAMPDGDGLHLIRSLRRRSAADGGVVPAIALTGHVGSVDQVRALLAGFQVHLPKPLHSAALFAAIERLVGVP